MSAQRGGIVIGWLVRVVLFLLVLGLVSFEAGAVIVAKVSIDSTADAAAQEGASEYARSHDQGQACAEAGKKATQGAARLVDCFVSNDGQFLTVTCLRIARTMFIQKIRPLRNHRVARATHRAKVT